MAKIILGIFMIFGLGACNLGPPMGPSDRNKELDDRRQLLELYDNLKGTYRGSVTTDSSKIDLWAAELILFTAEVQEGSDSEGNPKMRPVLQAKFKYLDYWGDRSDILLEGRFIKELGEVILTSRGTKGSAERLFNLKGNIQAENLSARITEDGGELGTFQAKRLTKSVVDSTDPEVERRKRITEQLEKVAGRYEGTMSPDRLDPWPCELEIFVLENETGPVLRGSFRRIGAIDGINDRFLSVRYISRTGQVLMTAREGDGGSNGRLPGSGFFSFVGSLTGDTLEGEAHENRANSGKLLLKKVK